MLARGKSAINMRFRCSVGILLAALPEHLEGAAMCISVAAIACLPSGLFSLPLGLGQ